MMNPASRRGFLRGVAIASATTATGALALPAAAKPAAPHPDADLLAASAEIERLEVERAAASEVYRAASRAVRREEDPIPDALMLNAEENILCRRWDRVGRLHFGVQFRWRRSREPEVEGVYRQPDPAWSGAALRRAIEHAVADLGHAGRTPHLLRRWRGLLPIADAYDQHVQGLYVRHRTRELRVAEQRIDEALQEARAHLRSCPATTPEGLAAHIWMFDGFTRENIPQHVLPLLLSAASVTVKFRDDEVPA